MYDAGRFADSTVQVTVYWQHRGEKHALRLGTSSSLVVMRTNESLSVGKEISVSSRDPYRIFHLIRLYAVEISATVVFLYWIVRALWHELHLP